MRNILAVVVCAGIPMIISAILKNIIGFSDYIMVTIYFVMFLGLFLLGKKKEWF
ncbi:MAG: hypothetical protein ACI4C5_02960 [Lachnospiraceae bacterium]